MQVVFSVERLSDVADEYAAFVKEYWNNTPENAREWTLDVNMELFCNLDRAGVAHLTVGRHKGKMVAAALYLIQRNPKHKSHWTALCDTFAVSRECRGQGVATRMMSFVEDAMRDTQAEEIINGYRMVYSTVPLFEKLGFELFEKYYRKPISKR